MSSASTARCEFSCRNVGRRPRGSLPVGPSTTSRSAISSSMISDTVLRCSPETRARSAREIGCCLRTRFRMRLRLICRGVRFEALCRSEGKYCRVMANLIRRFQHVRAESLKADLVYSMSKVLSAHILGKKLLKHEQTVRSQYAYG